MNACAVLHGIAIMSAETLARFGRPERFADAVEQPLDRLAEVIGDPVAFRNLLFGEEIGPRQEYDADRPSAAGEKKASC